MNIVLKRKPILKREPVECDGGAIIDKAIKLGEGELLDKARQISWDGVYDGSNPPKQLKETLASLQIEPFTHESVQAYKKQVDKKLKWKNMPVYILTGITAVTGLSAFLGLVVWFIAVPIAMLFTTLPLWAATIPLVTGILLGIAILTTHITDTYLKIKKARWYCISINSWDSNCCDHLYTENRMPLFALQTAVDIKKRCPNAFIYVDECNIEEKPADPFLVVFVGNERFYVEVWDEPGSKDVLRRV